MEQKAKKKKNLKYFSFTRMVGVGEGVREAFFLLFEILVEMDNVVSTVMKILDVWPLSICRKHRSLNCQIGSALGVGPQLKSGKVRTNLRAQCQLVNHCNHITYEVKCCLKRKSN